MVTAMVKLLPIMGSHVCHQMEFPAKGFATISTQIVPPWCALSYARSGSCSWWSLSTVIAFIQLLPLCILLSIARLKLDLKSFPHWLNSYGFSPVWIRTCVIKDEWWPTSFPTLKTFTGFLASMRSHMGPKGWRITKHSPTFLTFISFLSCVISLGPNKVRIASDHFSTQTVFMGFLSGLS